MRVVTGVVRVMAIVALLLCVGSAARASEVWVLPTYQADIGGLGIGSNTFWPVTQAGAVRLSWAVPGDLQTFEAAKIAVVPHTSANPITLIVFVCQARSGDLVGASCAGPFNHTFAGTANQLAEVDISATVAPHVAPAGANYLAVVAFTSPTTSTDHFVGMRVSYTTAAATLGANTFTGTQTAPKFVGDGSSLTNLPVPSGAATTGANEFTGTQTAPLFSGSFSGNGAALTNLPFPAGAATTGANAFAGTQTAPLFSGSFSGNGAALTNLPFPTGAATTGPNTFTGTQTFTAGNIVVDNATATTGVIMKGGVPFIHDFGSLGTNTFMGSDAGNLTLTTAAGNTGVGKSALHALTTGCCNVGVGLTALSKVSSGSDNVAVGENALTNNLVGVGNVGIGSFALANNNSTSNVAIGLLALGNSTGSNNLALGTSAGFNATNGSNNIYLGVGVAGVAGESNTMYLGKVGTQTKAFAAGVRGTTTTNNDAIPVVIDSAGQLGTISSSRRYKEDIHDMTDASRRLFDLRPVTFRYTKPYGDGTKPIQFGLVAEEVASVFPELAVKNASGDIDTVHYETLNVLLLNEVQRQEREIRVQQERIDRLERELDAMAHPTKRATAKSSTRKTTK